MFKKINLLTLSILAFSFLILSCGKDVSDRCKISMNLDGQAVNDNKSGTSCGVLSPSFVFQLVGDFENKGKLVVQVNDINSTTNINLSKSVSSGGASFTSSDGKFYHVGPDGTAKSKFKLSITQLDEDFTNNEKHAVGTFSGLLFTIDGKDSINITDGIFNH